MSASLMEQEDTDLLRLHVFISKIVLNFSSLRSVLPLLRKVFPILAVVNRNGTHLWMHTKDGMAARCSPFGISQLPPGILLLSKLDNKLITI